MMLIKLQMHSSIIIKLNFFLVLFAICFFVTFSNGQVDPTFQTDISSSNPKADAKWTVALEEVNKVFVENKGQVVEKTEPGNPILYLVRSNGVYIYFTAKGIFYRHDEFPVLNREEKEAHEHPENESDEKVPVPIKSSLYMNWIGSNSQVKIVPEEGVSNYFTYADLGNINVKETIKANAFKKIIYKNLYPGIDVEYSFPKNKPGIKYTIFVHPGANANAIKWKYVGEKSIVKDEQGNMVISSAFGDFIDHAPATYQNEKLIQSSFNIERTDFSFKFGSHKTNKLLVIDPWVTIPAFNGSSDAFDIDWDYKGNIYIYGGATNSYQLIKLNSAGNSIWTFTGVLIGGYGLYWYGDFAVNRNSGVSYIASHTLFRLNPSGVLQDFTGYKPKSEEIFTRIAYNSCTNKGVILGEGAEFGCLFDSTLASNTAVNVFPNDYEMECKSIAIDNLNCYFLAGNWSTSSVICKSPLGGLLPLSFQKASGYSLFDDSPYLGIWGINAIAKSKNYLYTYDGITLKKWDPGNGALSKSLIIGNSAVTGESGGIITDDCSNVFVGTKNGVSEYDSNLVFVRTVATPGVVYDIAIGIGNQVFACGKGFVSALNMYSKCNTGNLTLSTNSTGSTCNGNDGTASVNVTGNTTSLKYLWQPGGQTTQTAIGLAPGKYTVQVFEQSASCSNFGVTIDTVVVTSLSGFSSSSISITAPNCTDENTGIATETVTGGTTPYTYQWSISGQTNKTITGLKSGTYSITVKDALGCQIIDSVEIKSLNNLKVVAEIINDPCTIYNSTIKINISGGISPYQYYWSDGNYSLNHGYSTGTYSVTVTDGAGCSTILKDLKFTNAKKWDLVGTEIINACSKGKIALKFSTTKIGAPTGFFWKNQNGMSFSGDSVISYLPPGNYSCYISGCGKDSTIFFTILDGPRLTSQIQQICGGSSGSIKVLVNGGTFPYTYSWSNGSTSKQIKPITTPGTYNVWVSDSLGCTDSLIGLKVANEDLWKLLPPDIKHSCGYIDGSVKLKFKSLGSGVKFDWYDQSNNPLYGDSTILNLNAGKYHCHIYDYCIDTTIYVSVKYDGLDSITIGQSAITCGTGIGGKLWINDSNATKSTNIYTWNTSPPQYTDTINYLAAGYYSCMVENVNGCKATYSTMVNAPVVIYASAYQQNYSGCGTSNGSAYAYGYNGYGSYNYAWSNGNTQQYASYLSAGTYTVTVTDVSTGCSGTATVIISESSFYAYVYMLSDAGCGTSNGSASAYGGSGYGTYIYTWSNGNTQQTASNLSAGSYTVTVTDVSTNCSSTAVVSIGNSSFYAYASVLSSVSCGGAANGSAYAYSYPGNGTYNYTWSNGNTQQYAYNLSAGSYTVTVTDVNTNCSSIATVIISQSTFYAYAYLNSDAGCGASNGSAYAYGSSGNVTYNYTWSNGNTQQYAYNLSAGSYTVTVTDVSSNCSSTSNVYIKQLSLSALASSISDDICGLSNGSATVNVTGGSGNEVYTWSNGGTQQSVYNLSSGYYTVTVSNQSNSCTTTSVVWIYAVNSIYPYAGTSQQICEGSSVQLQSGGGTNYSWSPTSGLDNPLIANPIATPLITTLYTVTISTGNCIETATVAIQVNPLPQIIVSSDTTITKGKSIQLMSSGGIYYLWTPYDGLSDPGIANPIANPTGTTTYTVVVTDQYNCSSTKTLTIFVDEIVCGEIYVPTAFSPNNDGYNDILFVRGKCIKTFFFAVFNRWGEKVFETDNVSVGWNGKYRDQPCSNDNYTYYLFVKINDGSVVERKGNVVLIK